MQMKEKVSELRAKGRKIIDLTLGEPDFDTPEAVKKAAREALDLNLTHYTSAAGTPELRSEIASYLAKRGITASAGNIIATPGAKQAVFYLLSSICGAGDEVLLPEPTWLSYAEIAKLSGAKVVPVPSSEKEGFVPPIERLMHAAGSRAKAVIINNPANPTGAMYGRDYVSELAEFCGKKGICLISDEIYSDIVYGGAKFFSAAECGLESVVLVSGMSKMAAMTGWRIGYIAANEKIVQGCVKMQQQTATCPSSISQHAAIAALKCHSSYAGTMLSQYEKRRSLMVSGLSGIPKISFFIPKGAFYVFMDMRKICATSEEAALFLLEKAGVASVPGSAFGKSGEGWVRLSFATDERTILQAVAAIKGAL